MTLSMGFVINFTCVYLFFLPTIAAGRLCSSFGMFGRAGIVKVWRTRVRLNFGGVPFRFLLSLCAAERGVGFPLCWILYAFLGVVCEKLHLNLKAHTPVNLKL